MCIAKHAYVYTYTYICKYAYESINILIYVYIYFVFIYLFRTARAGEFNAWKWNLKSLLFFDIYKTYIHSYMFIFFFLHSTCGTIQRIKILYNKRDSALIQVFFSLLEFSHIYIHVSIFICGWTLMYVHCVRTCICT